MIDETLPGWQFRQGLNFEVCGVLYAYLGTNVISSDSLAEKAMIRGSEPDVGRG